MPPKTDASKKRKAIEADPMGMCARDLAALEVERLELRRRLTEVEAKCNEVRRKAMDDAPQRVLDLFNRGVYDNSLLALCMMALPRYKSDGKRQQGLLRFSNGNIGLCHSSKGNKKWHVDYVMTPSGRVCGYQSPSLLSNGKRTITHGFHFSRAVADAYSMPNTDGRTCTDAEVEWIECQHANSMSALEALARHLDRPAAARASAVASVACVLPVQLVPELVADFVGAASSVFQ